MAQSPIRVRAIRPQEMTATEKKAFIELVSAGGEVLEQGLAERVEQAVALVTIDEGAALVGTAAIKAPARAYRQGHFTKAGVAERASDYALELGWIVVRDTHRGRGYVRTLVEAALAAASGQGVYATTKSEHIRHVLPDYGFSAQGAPYASTLEPDAELTLLARPASP
jgi:predicted GNAT family N-acyltransferase